ncbi:MAG: LCP family protein [Clostridiales bacterium]|nr:LCP family protein [Clostridiales bacterium]
MSRFGRRSSWKRRVRKLRLTLAGLGLAALAVFAWQGVGRYQERKAIEAEIAAREALEEAANAETEGVDGSAAQTPDGSGPQDSSGSGTQASDKSGAQDSDGETSGLPDLNERTVIWQGETWRRSGNVRAILCMGVDRSDELTEYRSLAVEGKAGQADGIFLMAWDSARGQARLLMIPRDTMTEITALNDDGSLRGKEVDHLTLAYAYGDGREMSCDNMSESVSHLLLDLPIQNYLASDLAVIATLNDAVGGVTVTVPTEGMETADPAFVQGATITLHGDQAERFVRYRDITKDNSALYRMDQHKQYIQGYFAALREQSKYNSNLVSDLFAMIQDYMITDMSKDEYLKTGADVLAGEGIPEDGYYTLPGIGMATATYDEYYPNLVQAVPMLLELFFYKVP